MMLLRRPLALLALCGVARAQVVINEVLANPDADPVEEWAELYNPDAAAADVGGFTVSDNRGHGASGSVVLEAGTTVPAGGFLVVVLRTNDGYLNNGGDGVQLFDGDGTLIDEIHWLAAAPAARLSDTRRPARSFC